jgi:D-proline reductase (dithiol) PrdB
MAEEAGIPTISMGNMADRMACIKPPRALLVKFPRGSMLGEPENKNRQRRIIMDALDALKTITEPGTVCELPYKWKRADPPQ